VRIHYFSGTGNTARAVGILQEGLSNAGYKVETRRVDRVNPALSTADRPGEEEKETALEIFAFPVYATAVPQIFRQYLIGLPLKKGKRAAVLAIFGDTYLGQGEKRRHMGGDEGQALLEASRLLKRRGYSVSFRAGVGYPVNWTMVAAPPNEEDCQSIFRQADEQISLIATSLAAGESCLKPCSFSTQLWSWPFGLLYRFFGRRIIGKLYAARAMGTGLNLSSLTRTCTQCGLCVRTCPAAAIHLSGGRPLWNWNCQGCARCINLCPAQAIQTSLARLLLIGLLPLLLPYNSWLFAWTGVDLLAWAGTVGGVCLAILAWTVGVLVITAQLDRLIALLERIPFLRRPLSFSHTRLLRRYLAPGFDPSPRLVRRNLPP